MATETKSRTVGSEILETITGVQVEYCGRVPKGYPEELQQFVETWVYEQETISVEQWFIDEELTADPDITELEAIQRAVIEIGYLAWLNSLDYDANFGVALSPIVRGVK